MSEITNPLRVLKTTKVGVDFYQKGTVFAPGTLQHSAFNRRDIESGLVEEIAAIPQNTSSAPVFTSDIDIVAVRRELERKKKKTDDA